MNPSTDRHEDAAANDPRQELARLHEQIERASGRLADLHQQIAMAASDIGSSRQSHLLEANARLLSATLRARTDAENAARALEEMAHAAELDALTQLPGRAPLFERFAHAMASARRHGTRLALLFLDLDNFKQINDTLGHVVGDAVLKLVAQHLVSGVRETDMVCRYGDDEFLVLGRASTSCRSRHCWRCHGGPSLMSLLRDGQNAVPASQAMVGELIA